MHFIVLLQKSSRVRRLSHDEFIRTRKGTFVQPAITVNRNGAAREPRDIAFCRRFVQERQQTRDSHFLCVV